MSNPRTPAPTVIGGDKEFIVTAKATVSFDSRDGRIRTVTEARNEMLEVLAGLSTREFTITTEVVPIPPPE